MYFDIVLTVVNPSSLELYDSYTDDVDKVLLELRKLIRDHLYMTRHKHTQELNITIKVDHDR